jgi:putative phage-type endonuclease
MSIQFIKGKNMEKDLQQNSSSWLEWRKKGIGSSDVPAILGLCPYRTALDIYMSKQDDAPENKGNWAMQKGHDLEPIARAHYEIFKDADFPAELVQHKDHEFLRASLDGLNKELNHHIEIKFVGDETFEAGVCPTHYYAQIQFQMAIAGTTCDLVMINKAQQVKIIEVKRDDEYIKSMLPTLFKFWDDLQNKIAPIASEKQKLKFDDSEMLAMFTEYEAMKIKADGLEKSMDEIKKKLIAITPHEKIKCGKYSLSKSEVKGRVKYDDVPELKNVDLEKYRGAPSTQWKITIGK